MGHAYSGYRSDAYYPREVLNATEIAQEGEDKMTDESNTGKTPIEQLTEAKEDRNDIRTKPTDHHAGPLCVAAIGPV